MDKRFKYGAFSAVTALIVIAVLIAVNLVADKLNFQADLTSQEIYTISDKSVEALQNIDKDINLYVMAKTGEEDHTVQEILKEYENASSNINVIYKDPYLYPGFTKDYAEEGEEIAVNSIIVESGERFKIIPASDLYNYDYDYMTGGYSVQSIAAEYEITNALQYVTMDSVPVIYYVQGHNEKTVPSILKEQFEKSNYQIKELNLSKDGGIPDDCNILMITTPAVDYSEQEADKVIEYLGKDGCAAVFLDFGTEFKNLNRIINAYGVSVSNSVIIEGDKSHYYEAPVFLMPDIVSNEITSDLASSGYALIIPYGQSIDTLDLKKNSVTVEPLLKTSSASYSKTSLNPQSVNFEEGDVRGPFDLAVAVTDSYYTDTNHTTKLVVCGSSVMISDEGIASGNLSFALRAMDWLRGESGSIYIAPKSLETELFYIDESTSAAITAFACGVLPVFIFGTGIFVWLRRRNG